MARMHVGVLRGGPSREYDVSLLSGSAVLQHLSEEKYATRDIFVDRSGQWHLHGRPVEPERTLRGIDVVFNAMHGEYGEDGTVQHFLDTHRIPYTGSGRMGAALAIHKARAKERIQSLEGVRLLPHVTLYREAVGDAYHETARDIFTRFGPPYIIKPLASGSSLGVTLVETVADLPDYIFDAFEEHDALIVEPYIRGKEATCGVIEKLRDERIYALPPIEIIVPEGKLLWDYNAKYDGVTTEVCPGNFTYGEKERMQRAARAAHESLGLRDYSRSDFIVAPSGIYFLEVNTLPGLPPVSLFPKAVEAVGMTFPDFLDHLVQLALQRR